MTTSRLVLGQMDINAVNKPVELLNSANEDIENGNYTDAVQKLLAAGERAGRTLPEAVDGMLYGNSKWKQK